MVDTLLISQGTLLTLTPLSGFASMQLTPYAARGLSQTFEILTGSGGGGANVWTRRDVNGYLRSVVDTRFRKYKSTITCKDTMTPCLDDAWIGITCSVDCCFELSYPTGATPSRPAVAGSQRVEGTVTFYRPILLMMVTDIKTTFAEWQANYDWSIALEEV